MKYISVPSKYVVYQVPDDTYELLPNGMLSNPSQLVLELMVANGAAQRMGEVGTSIGSFPSAEVDEEGEGDDDVHLEEGDSPWVEDDE